MKLAVSHGGEVRVIGELPAGDKGIRNTLAAMKARVDEAALDETIRHAARLFMAEPASYRGSPRFLERVYEWLRDQRRFAEDPEGVELLHDPVELLAAMRAGQRPGVDCDDVAMLGAALLKAAGYRPVLIVVGKTPKAQGGRYHHTFFGSKRADAANATVASVIPLDPQEGFFAKWPPVTGRVGMVEV